MLGSVILMSLFGEGGWCGDFVGDGDGGRYLGDDSLFSLSFRVGLSSIKCGCIVVSSRA